MTMLLHLHNMLCFKSLQYNDKLDFMNIQIMVTCITCWSCP